MAVARRVVTLVAACFAVGAIIASPAGASVTKSGYIPMPDGVQLSYAVVLPAGQGRFPVALVYDGYAEGTQPGSNDPALAADLEAAGYAVLGVSVRGTGCSTGTFDLRSPEESTDGAAAVRWAAGQPWSSGRVGMFGDSFPGLTQPGVAALGPPALKAIAPFQLVDDVYRDVGYPGGVYNGEFGAFWGLGDQPSADASNPVVATVPAPLGGRGAPTPCDANYLRHVAANMSTNIFLSGTEHPWFDRYWQIKAVGSSAERLHVSVLGCVAWQDDEVGSNPAWTLWRHVDQSRLWLIASNGYHGMCDQYNEKVNRQVVRFFDRYVRGVQNGFERTPHVQIWHEAHTVVSSSGSGAPVTINLGPLGHVGGSGGAPENVPSWISTFPSWPPATTPIAVYLHSSGLLDLSPPHSEMPEGYAYPRPPPAPRMGSWPDSAGCSGASRWRAAGRSPGRHRGSHTTSRSSARPAPTSGYARQLPTLSCRSPSPRFAPTARRPTQPGDGSERLTVASI